MLEFVIKPGVVDLTPEVEGYIRERAHHLDAFYDGILTCRVILDAPVRHHRTGGPFGVKIDLDVPGAVIAVTRQEADNLHVAVRNAFEATQRRLEDYARKQHGQVKTPAVHTSGEVVRIFSDEGYGFLRAKDGHEVYFHQHAVVDEGFEALRVGSEVRYVEEMGDKGPQASTVDLMS
jgi:cold shock CspA family protein